MEPIRRPLYSNIVPRVIIPLVSSRERETGRYFIYDNYYVPYFFGSLCTQLSCHSVRLIHRTLVTLSPCNPVTLLLRYPVTLLLLPRYHVTVLPVTLLRVTCYLVTLLAVTPLPCYFITVLPVTLLPCYLPVTLLP